MSYLLDTCTLLWLVNRSDDLSPLAQKISAEASATLNVSAISAWEIGLKQARGRLSLRQPLEEWWAKVTRRHGLTELAIDGKIAIRSTDLPQIHSDPADRLLIATAQEHGLTILTPDPLIAKYPDVKTLW